MTTLATVIGLFQSAVGGLTGVNYAPTYPPENAADFPFVVTFVDTYRGEMNTPEDFRMLYTIRVELHVARKDLPEDVKKLLDYPEIGANAIFKTLKTNVLAHAGIEGAFGKMEWDSVETIGWYWLIKDVKIITTIT